MNNEEWDEFYLLAAKETDRKKMPERIAAVRGAIRGRLQELAQSSDHHAERQKMETTLKNLDVLEAESQKW